MLWQQRSGCEWRAGHLHAGLDLQRATAMIRALAIAALAACSSTSAPTPSGTTDERAAQAPSAAPAPSATAADACAEACAHRAECIAPGTDVAACASECRTVRGVLSDADLAAFPKLTCEQVKVVEPAFRAAVSCHRACTHRAECVTGASDLASCVDTCTALGYRANELEARYTSADCAAVQQLESAFDRSRACLAGCRHALTCGVRGDLARCVTQCETGLDAGQLDRPTLDELTAADCATVVQRVVITQPDEPSSAGGGGTSADCARIGASLVGGVCAQTFACRKLGCPDGWSCGVEGYCHSKQYPNCQRCP